MIRFIMNGECILLIFLLWSVSWFCPIYILVYMYYVYVTIDVYVSFSICVWFTCVELTIKYYNQCLDKILFLKNICEQSMNSRITSSKRIFMQQKWSQHKNEIRKTFIQSYL